MQPLLVLLAFSFMLGLAFNRVGFWQLVLLAMAGVMTSTVLFLRTGYM